MKKILYVEDDPVNALVIRKFLEKEFEVIHMVDGESCIEYLQSHPVDLVLMDINLGRGKKDGVETQHSIRKIPNRSAIPVIAVTAYAMPEDEQRFLNQGFNFYLSKPVDRLVLINVINELLSK